VPGIADAVARETAWFQADLSAQGIPHLLKAGANDGPFGIVDAYPRRLSQRSHQLYLWREAITQTRRGSGTHELRHFLVATVLWSQAATPERAHEDQARLDDAIARVFARVAGGGDRSHGRRFTSVGAAKDNNPGIGARMADPLAAIRAADAPGGLGRAYEVHVRFVATETVEDP
jgi:hypothetical protein